MTAVVGLTFLFGFGNVWTLALRLGVPTWVAPLVAPAVDLSVMGLLLGTRYLALHGAGAGQLRPARRLLVFSSVMTLALNITDPLLAGQTGKAAFDAVGPLLLIGWSEVGPGLLQAISGVRGGQHQEITAQRTMVHAHDGGPVTNSGASAGPIGESGRPFGPRTSGREVHERVEDELLARARREDARHWQEQQRPISAETLRKRLHIGAARSRMLVGVIRSDNQTRRVIDLAEPTQALKH
jgi:hypothetical protein